MDSGARCIGVKADVIREPPYAIASSHLPLVTGVNSQDAAGDAKQHEQTNNLCGDTS